ncbi:MAG: hypothetical protein IKU71_07405 [Kiritimatiellae bacterium]|nr:hypothetical protein [Kiritimatiellia bacterium]
MQRQIDCYGFEATSEHFQRRKLEAYLVKNDGDIIYECFGNGDPRPIHRIDHDPENAPAPEASGCPSDEVASPEGRVLSGFRTSPRRSGARFVSLAIKSASLIPKCAAIRAVSPSLSRTMPSIRQHAPH